VSIEDAESAWTSALAGAQEAAIDFLAASEVECDVGYLESYVRATVSASRLVQALAQLDMRTRALSRFDEYPQVAA
jgi:hypothetical protein